MKKIILLIVFICGGFCCAHEPVKIINPDKNTKIEVHLKKDARDLGGKLDIIKGAGDFDIILCDEKGAELKRTRTQKDGEYSFGKVGAGKYLLKLENKIKPQSEKFNDKAAPNIMDIPYLRETQSESQENF